MRRPLPQPTPDTQPYWDAARRGELLLPFCRPCGRFFYYPRPFCPTCFRWDVEWRRASGRGTLHSYAVHHRALTPGFDELIPYVPALVDLEEGVRVVTRLVDVDPASPRLRVGAPVEASFDAVTEEITLVHFRLVQEGQQ